MFVDIKILKSLIKSAYKGSGITIENQYDGMAIHTDFWGVWIAEEDLTNEIKAAVVEVLGGLPGEDEAYTCWNKRENQTAIVKTLFDKEKLEMIARQQSALAKITPILYEQETESKEIVLCRVLQTTDTAKIYEEVGEKPIYGSVALVNDVFSRWIAPDNLRMRTGEEGRPVGPMMSIGNATVIWYNEKCLMYCFLRDDSKEREEGMIKALELRKW